MEISELETFIVSYRLVYPDGIESIIKKFRVRGVIDKKAAEIAAIQDLQEPNQKIKIERIEQEIRFSVSYQVGRNKSTKTHSHELVAENKVDAWNKVRLAAVKKGVDTKSLKRLSINKIN